MSLLIAIVGHTCAGKGTVLKELRDKWEFATPVSCTTRSPRPGETQGVHYDYITHLEFENRQISNYFAESKLVHTNWYGTPFSELTKYFEVGKDLILDIDIEGAVALKERFPQTKIVFIYSDQKEMEDRMEKRGSGETESEKQLRFQTACFEMKRAEEVADFWIRNQFLAETVDSFLELLKELKNGGPSNPIRFRNPTMLKQCRSAFFNTLNPAV